MTTMLKYKVRDGRSIRFVRVFDAPTMRRTVEDDAPCFQQGTTRTWSTDTKYGEIFSILDHNGRHLYGAVCTLVEEVM